jgi:hypothetical protein
MMGDRMLLEEHKQVKEDVSIESPEELKGREIKCHWHWTEKRYSVSLRASNGRWYVVRHRETGAQLFFGKLVLKNVHFKVSPAGAKKAYESGNRNVHATVMGTVLFAKYIPEKAVVPCGIYVSYRHTYPEPEFKTSLSDSPLRTPMKNWPGIKSAEMVSIGCTNFDKDKRHPMMLATGNIELTEGI